MEKLNTLPATKTINTLFDSNNTLRDIIVIGLACIAAYVLSHFLAQGIIFLAQRIGTMSEHISNQKKFVRYRQIETYLSITVAAVRLFVVLGVAWLTWWLLNPTTNSSLLAIALSALVVVFAGQTLGIVLRDITAGSAMILEQWFNVGDYIQIEPFENVSGVVERFTLRSTKLRNLNGEIVWVHNQQISAVHVVPHGIRTIAVDVFVRDKELGLQTLRKLIQAIPAGPAMLQKPLKIKSAEEWSDDLWRITVIGKTAPGREWLIEQFFVNSIKEVDEGRKGKSRIFTYAPIARYADPVADRKFKRAVRDH